MCERVNGSLGRKFSKLPARTFARETSYTEIIKFKYSFTSALISHRMQSFARYRRSPRRKREINLREIVDPREKIPEKLRDRRGMQRAFCTICIGVDAFLTTRLMDGNRSFTGASVESLKNDPAHRRAHTSQREYIDVAMHFIYRVYRKDRNPDRYVDEAQKRWLMRWLMRYKETTALELETSVRHSLLIEFQEHEHPFFLNLRWNDVHCTSTRFHSTYS